MICIFQALPMDKISTKNKYYQTITKTNKQKSCGFGPGGEVMLEVMPEVMSDETALIK